MSEDGQVKLWRCPGGHVLGEVKRVGRVRRLFLYRMADSPQDVIGIFTGAADEVRCSSCGQTSEWDPPMDALNELMEVRAKLRRHRKGIDAKLEFVHAT